MRWRVEQANSLNAAAGKCRCVRVENGIELVSPAFVYRLDSAGGLKGISWENRRTGKQISLGTWPEAEFDLDASQRRIFITGWKASFWGGENIRPDEETGYKKGVAARSSMTAVSPAGQFLPPP